MKKSPTAGYTGDQRILPMNPEIWRCTLQAAPAMAAAPPDITGGITRHAPDNGCGWPTMQKPESASAAARMLC